MYDVNRNAKTIGETGTKGHSPDSASVFARINPVSLSAEEPDMLERQVWNFRERGREFAKIREPSCGIGPPSPSRWLYLQWGDNKSTRNPIGVW